VLVTGATSGIGLAAARQLAARGAYVVVGARDPERGLAIAAELQRTGAGAELCELNLASFTSIRSAVRTFTANHSKLDVLINNAGIFALRRGASVDGHELTWATNFLGLFLLTQSLLPLLRRAPGPRVVNVSSGAHRYGRIQWSDLDMRHRYSGGGTYAQSKLAVNLFTRELAKREARIATFAVHPGTIATGIWRDAPAPVRVLLGAILTSPKRGAVPLVRLALDEAGPSGSYFDKLHPAAPSPQSLNEADAARLWEYAEEITAQKSENIL